MNLVTKGLFFYMQTCFVLNEIYSQKMQAYCFYDSVF